MGTSNMTRLLTKPSAVEYPNLHDFFPHVGQGKKEITKVLVQLRIPKSCSVLQYNSSMHDQQQFLIVFFPQISQILMAQFSSDLLGSQYFKQLLGSVCNRQLADVKDNVDITLGHKHMVTSTSMNRQIIMMMGKLKVESNHPTFSQGSHISQLLHPNPSLSNAIEGQLVTALHAS